MSSTSSILQQQRRVDPARCRGGVESLKVFINLDTLVSISTRPPAPPEHFRDRQDVHGSSLRFLGNPQTITIQNPLANAVAAATSSSSSFSSLMTNTKTLFVRTRPFANLFSQIVTARVDCLVFSSLPTVLLDEVLNKLDWMKYLRAGGVQIVSPSKTSFADNEHVVDEVSPFLFSSSSSSSLSSASSLLLTLPQIGVLPSSNCHSRAIILDISKSHWHPLLHNQILLAPRQDWAKSLPRYVEPLGLLISMNLIFDLVNLYESSSSGVTASQCLTEMNMTRFDSWKVFVPSTSTSNQAVVGTTKSTDSNSSGINSADAAEKNSGARNSNNSNTNNNNSNNNISNNNINNIASPSASSAGATATTTASSLDFVFLSDKVRMIVSSGGGRVISHHQYNDNPSSSNQDRSASASTSSNNFSSNLSNNNNNNKPNLWLYVGSSIHAASSHSQFHGSSSSAPSSSLLDSNKKIVPDPSSNIDLVRPSYFEACETLQIALPSALFSVPYSEAIASSLPSSLLSSSRNYNTKLLGSLGDTVVVKNYQSQEEMFQRQVPTYQQHVLSLSEDTAVAGVAGAAAGGGGQKNSASGIKLSSKSHQNIGDGDLVNAGATATTTSDTANVDLTQWWEWISSPSPFPAENLHTLLSSASATSEEVKKELTRIEKLTVSSSSSSNSNSGNNISNKMSTSSASDQRRILFTPQQLRLLSPADWVASETASTPAKLKDDTFFVVTWLLARCFAPFSKASQWLPIKTMITCLEQVKVEVTTPLLMKVFDSTVILSGVNELSQQQQLQQRPYYASSSSINTNKSIALAQNSSSLRPGLTLFVVSSDGLYVARASASGVIHSRYNNFANNISSSDGDSVVNSRSAIRSNQAYFKDCSSATEGDERARPPPQPEMSTQTIDFSSQFRSTKQVQTDPVLSAPALAVPAASTTLVIPPQPPMAMTAPAMSDPSATSNSFSPTASIPAAHQNKTASIVQTTALPQPHIVGDNHVVPQGFESNTFDDFEGYFFGAVEQPLDHINNNNISNNNNGNNTNTVATTRRPRDEQQHPGGETAHQNNASNSSKSTTTPTTTTTTSTTAASGAGFRMISSKDQLPPDSSYFEGPLASSNSKNFTNQKQQQALLPVPVHYQAPAAATAPAPPAALTEHDYHKLASVGIRRDLLLSPGEWTGLLHFADQLQHQGLSEVANILRSGVAHARWSQTAPTQHTPAEGKLSR